ncbi:PRD domain-containing protein, partial [Staphylococcus aureus]
MMQHVVLCVSQELEIDMSNDHRLRTRMLTHLRPDKQRIKYDMTQANPLQQAVDKRYPQVVDAIIKHISTI